MLTERLRIRDIRNTSTFRLTALFGIVFVGSVTILLGAIYVLSARELTRRSDMILRSEVTVLDAVPPEALPQHIDSEITRSADGLNYFELQSPRGEHVTGNLYIRNDPPLGHAIEIANLRGIDRPIRLLAVRTPSDETLLVGRDIMPVLDLRQRVLAILLGSGLATAIAVLVSGVALSIAPLRRVRDLQLASKTIAAGNLEARMPLAGRGDELDLFAGTVNAMIEEVERVVGQVKGVTDAVAHDLRTPLTRVRSQLYRFCQSEDVGSTPRTLIQSAIGDLDLVLERFAALLRISELEAHGRRAGFCAVDLRELASSVHDLYEPLAEERGVALSVEGTVAEAVHGDEKLLFEAVSNLVDNAIKFSPANGCVRIEVKSSAAGPAIEVHDRGPGIPGEERRAVLRRFHRSADAAGVPGSGLGLSVVAAIVHLHAFTLEFEDGEPGLVARILCTDSRLGRPLDEFHLIGDRSEKRSERVI